MRWTYDLIKNEASKYKSSGEFRKYCRNAYDYACKHNILNDFFDSTQKKWSKKEIKFEASKYASKNEFKQGNNRAYQAALRYNIIDELFDNKLIYWTKEKIIEESKKYKSKREFKLNCVSAYNYALKNGIINELYDNIYNKWTDESVIEESKKYNNKKDFYTNSRQAYQYSLRHNLIESFYWLINDKDDGNQRCVYVYIDDENKVAYVGITVNKEERHISHSTGKFRNKNTKSSVYEYFNNINKKVPEPIYLEDNLSIIESQEKEDYYRKKYENLGYKMLNVANTGIGVGSIGGYHKWTKRSLKIESLKYKTKTELYKNNRSAYNYAVSHNLIDELYDNVNKIWNDELVITEASKYSCKFAFKKGCSGAYNYAYRKNMLELLFPKKK